MEEIFPLSVSVTNEHGKDTMKMVTKMLTAQIYKCMAVVSIVLCTMHKTMEWRDASLRHDHREAQKSERTGLGPAS